MTQHVNDVIDALATRLAVPAAHLWGVLVRQAAIEFWESVAGFVVALAVFAYVFRRFRRAEYYGGELALFGTVLFGVVLLVATVNLFLGVGYLVNPEYYALHELLGALK